MLERRGCFGRGFAKRSRFTELFASTDRTTPPQGPFSEAEVSHFRRRVLGASDDVLTWKTGWGATVTDSADGRRRRVAVSCSTSAALTVIVSQRHARWHTKWRRPEAEQRGERGAGALLSSRVSSDSGAKGVAENERAGRRQLMKRR